MARLTLDKRFFAKVHMTDGCWLWMAGREHGGYGQFRVAGKTVLAHRFGYEQMIGPVPKNLTLDHLCRVRNCVRPEHLEAVTIQENILRSPIAPPAINARMTHCKQGHALTGPNVRFVQEHGKTRRRQCRTCVRERARARKESQREYFREYAKRRWQMIKADR